MNENDNGEHTLANKSSWAYCPVCGNKLPQVNNLKYCVKCGIDLQYIKNYLIKIPKKHPDTISQLETFPFKPEFYKMKITDEELITLSDQKLWGSLTSIGIPIAAYFFMNMIATIIILFILILTLNLADFTNMLLNPYILIISSFAELVFFLVPVLYVGKFLQNPTFNNRLYLLGFTYKGFDKQRILKEFLIGFGFAIIGIFLVGAVSFFMESILELIFGVEIVYNIGSTFNEIDIIISSSDIFSIILLSITMIMIIGTSEEILFRGFMQKGLVRTLGNKSGIIITAIIFSIIHLIGIFLIIPFDPLTAFISFLLNFFPYFAISLLLGLLYHWRKENLIAVIITHGFYNALTIILVFIYFSYL